MLKLSTIVKQLEERNPMPSLCPKKVWNDELTQQIEELFISEGTVDPSLHLKNETIQSALLLWNDDLYPSHSISQDIHNELGSYLHGMMHRREGDFSNAKYWFYSVGNHEIFHSLYEQASEISAEVKSWGSWNPNLYIDAVERVFLSNAESSQEGEVLRQIQVVEMSLLVDYILGEKISLVGRRTNI